MTLVGMLFVRSSIWYSTAFSFQRYHRCLPNALASALSLNVITPSLSFLTKILLSKVISCHFPLSCWFSSGSSIFVPTLSYYSNLVPFVRSRSYFVSTEICWMISIYAFPLHYWEISNIFLKIPVFLLRRQYFPPFYCISLISSSLIVTNVISCTNRHKPVDDPLSHFAPFLSQCGLPLRRAFLYDQRRLGIFRRQTDSCTVTASSCPYRYRWNTQHFLRSTTFLLSLLQCFLSASLIVLRSEGHFLLSFILSVNARCCYFYNSHAQSICTGKAPSPRCDH